MKPDIEPILTIEPLPCVSICLPKARQHQNSPSTLTSIWKRQWSSLVSSARTSLLATPALLTRISTRPCVLTTSARGRVHILRLGDVERDADAHRCPASSARRRSTRRGPASCRRRSTLAPASPSACAQAAPMPCPPPVTTATLPSSFNFSRYMFLSFSTHPVAAVDIERLGDDIIAFGRGEKDRAADMIFRLCPCGPHGTASPTRRFFSPWRRFSYLANSASTLVPHAACRRRRARCH